ncbi:MAG: zraS 7 [Acidobacteria bacterium]|nr:zraS 7 [Acidobacteriota bacterium]
MPAMRGALGELRRQYVLAAAVFAVLLLVAFALFSTLLIHQLSRSYVEDTLLSGRSQAEQLAQQVTGEGSLYRVVETRREELARVSSALARQQVVDSIKVYDDRGKLVYTTEITTEGLSGGFPDAHSDLAPPTGEPEVVETGRSYEIRVPAEDLGTVVFSLPKPALEARIAILRRKLLVNTALAGGVGFVMLLGAVVFIWHLVQRNAELERRRRLDEELASLGTLAANLAHEIRNPLNALSINLELLREDVGARPAADTVEMARREVERLSRLVDDFLTYARPSTPTLESADGAELVGQVAELLAPVCERAGIAVAVAAEPAPLRVDRGQIEQVLVNLALNAVQALDGSGRAELGLACRAEGDVAVLEVTDTGPGIPRAQLGRVREAFFSLRKGGTGLGLAIADRIVEAHGGRLELANRPEGGLAARVVLPLARH